ncbi:DUF2442 domain-containing protein [Pseudomonas turukhanskensis]|uniref:DUF2442 domain-containing protein n=1 Tax=Pseudomonas turukhanskensis TaxID=1806536 RepID=A0A9W6K407_9PSED|nr:DUF2442 domain-containing protein [Pseudomonas turukhanskensis]GLK87335.1 hypothetical protein GCM10017655_03970 [Pseudomonas turukhanskensis]
MNSKLRIAAVEPLPAKHSLRLTWSDGRALNVNLAEAIHTFAVLTPLQDPALFQQAQVGEWGFDVAWPGDIEVSAATLYRLAMEQAGQAMPKRAFKDWMHRHGLSLTGAAQALHLTRRTITAYSSGPNPIPYHIALACKGWEVLHGAGSYPVAESERGQYCVEAASTKPKKSASKRKPTNKNGAL